MVFIVAPPPPPRSQTQAPWGPRFGSAPAYGSKVRVSLPAYPALIPQRTLCASGTDGANSYRASGALPQQPKSGVAGGPWTGSSRVTARRRSFRLHFRESRFGQGVPKEALKNGFYCRSASSTPRSQTQAPWGPRFGSASAYGSKVRVSLPGYPALIPQRTLCASGTDGANSYRASGALPQQPKSGVAGGPWAGSSRVTDRRSFRLHFRERH